MKFRSLAICLCTFWAVIAISCGGDDDSEPTPEPTVTPTPTPQVLVGEERLEVEGTWPDLAYGPDDVLHLAYVRRHTMYYRQRSADGLWSAEEVVPGTQEDTAFRFYPRIRVDAQGNAHIVSVDRDPYLLIRYDQRRVDGSWEGPLDALVDGDGAGDTNRPDIAISPAGEIWVVAQKDFSIFATRKGESGFTDVTNLSGKFDPEPQYPSIAVRSDGTFYVAWGNSYVCGEGRAAYTKLVPGSNWTAPECLTYSGGLASATTLATGADDTVHMAFLEWNFIGGFNKIQYLQDPGTGWSAGTVVQEKHEFIESEFIPHPALYAGPDGTVLLSYNEFDDFSAIDNRAFYRLRRDGNWGPERRFLEDSISTEQRWSSIAGTGNQVAVALMDDTRGSIYIEFYDISTMN